MSKDINNFLKQFSIIGELQNNSQFIGRKKMYDGTQFENFIMVPGSGKSTEGTLTITPIDSNTKLYQTNRDIWGFTTSLRPEEEADITLYFGVNFVPTSLLSEYSIAIGISDGPIDEVYKKVDFDLAAITSKYNDILARGSYLTIAGQDVAMLHQGQNWGLVSNWGLFNPGGLFSMQIKSNQTAVDFNYSYGYVGTGDISGFANPTITLTFIKTAQSVIEDKIYVTITETSQDPSSNDQQTGITTISNTPTNYSYILVNPFPVLNNSGRHFRVTFTNPGNDLSNESMYIGISDQPTPLNFSTDTSFISYINSKRALSSTTTLQTIEGFFYTGGIADLVFDNNKLTVTKGTVSLDLTAYPSNHIMFGIRTNGVAIQPIQVFFEEIFPVVPPSNFIENVDSYTNKYTMEASMWGVVVNESQQLSVGSAYNFAVNFDGSSVLSNYILAVGITEELVSEVITKSNFAVHADGLQRFNFLLSKGFFIVSDSTTDPYQVRILEKGTEVSTHQSNLFISGAEGSFTLSVVNSVKLNYGSGETAYFPTSSSTLYLTFAYLKREFALNVDSYLITYSGSLIDVTNPMANSYTAFPNSLGYKYNFAIPISRTEPVVDKLIITNTNLLSGSEFYCGVTKYNSTGILPFGLAESNFTNTYASTLRGNQTIDFNQVFSSGGTITITTSGNTVEFTNDAGVSTYGLPNDNGTYYIFWGTTSSAQFNSITLVYEEITNPPFVDNVIGGGDGTANENTKFIPYNLNSWGQLIDLGPIGPTLECKRIQFETYLNFPINDVVVLLGTAIGPMGDKNFLKLNYPSLINVTAETDAFKNLGISYRFNSDFTHSVYINNVINTNDNTNSNVTGSGFWLFNGEYLSISRINGTSAALSSQRGVVNVGITNTALHAYLIVYKLNEVFHNTIKVSYRDNASRTFDFPFNYLDYALVDRRQYEQFNTHPQNYATICTIPYKIGDTKKWLIRFEGVNDILNQKIYIGVCSNTFKRDFIDKADFNAFTSTNESFNSFGNFQTDEGAFTTSKYINFTGVLNDCAVSCGNVNYLFANSTGKFVYIGIKYDSPISIKCLLYVTDDEYMIADKLYDVIVPRYFRGISVSIAKIPDTFTARLLLPDVLSTDRLELRINNSMNCVYTEGTGGSLVGISIPLNSAALNFNGLPSINETLVPTQSNFFYTAGSNHNTNVTIYYIDNWMYIKSNGEEFAVKFFMYTAFFALSITQNSTKQISNGEMIQRVGFGDYSTNVIAPTGYNSFSSDGVAIFTSATVLTSVNVGNYYKLYDDNAWGDTSFNPLFKNAFTWDLTTNSGPTTGSAYFIGFVENASIITSTSYGSITSFETAIADANATGIFIAPTNALYRNGIKTFVGSIQYIKAGYAFYNDKLYLATYHNTSKEITQIYKIRSGLDRTKTYTLIWGAITSSVRNFQHTLYTGRLQGYLGD